MWWSVYTRAQRPPLVVTSPELTPYSKGEDPKEKKGWVLRLEETTFCSNPSFDRRHYVSKCLPDLALVTYSKLMTELVQSSDF